MKKCLSCGDENKDEAKFCRSCGTALAEEAKAGEVRQEEPSEQEGMSYKCPSCGAPLVFSASSGKLFCHSCENEYDVEAIKCGEKAGKTEFDWGEYKSSLSDERLENTKTYICKSCGAEIEADENTAATHCPYCDNEVVLGDRVNGSLRPNAIIPFKIERDELHSRVKAFFKGKRLLPNGFLDENKLKDIKGVYVPFWLFDSTLDGSVVLDGTKTRHYTSGSYDCTETKHYLLEREGSMSFERVPADGSVRMDNDLMDSIEPFDYSELVDFNSANLSGFVADRFDSDPDAELPRVTERMMNSATDTFAETASEYSVSLRSNNMSLTAASVKYVLLPVYLINCEYKGKNYRYAVNGQTGKVVGELPISKLKRFLWGLGSFVVGFIAAFTVLVLIQ